VNSHGQESNQTVLKAVDVVQADVPGLVQVTEEEQRNQANIFSETKLPD